MDQQHANPISAATQAAVLAAKSRGLSVPDHLMNAVIAVALDAIARSPECPVPKSLSHLAHLFDAEAVRDRGAWFSVSELLRLQLPGVHRNQSKAHLQTKVLAMGAPHLMRYAYRRPGEHGAKMVRVFHPMILPKAAQDELRRRGLWDGLPPMVGVAP